MDYSLINVLPHLDSIQEEDVKEWYDNFDNIIKMARIDDTETVYRLTYMISEGEARKRLKEWVPNDGEYPTLPQIKKFLIDTKKLSKTEIYDRVKGMTIQKDQDIEDFNKVYLELYNQVSKEMKEGIQVRDYLKSIKSRRGACRAIFYDECKTIEEAMRSAEKVQKLLEFERTNLEIKENEPRTTTWPLSGSHHRPDQKKQTDPYSTPKNFIYRSQWKENKSVPVLANTKLHCYRCKEEGHKVYQCPYNDEELLTILTQRIANKGEESQKIELQKN